MEKKTRTHNYIVITDELNAILLQGGDCGCKILNAPFPSPSVDGAGGVALKLIICRYDREIDLFCPTKDE